MLTKSKSKQILKFKYALLIPMVFGMLLYTSCDKENIEKTPEAQSVTELIEQLQLAIESNSEISLEDRKAVIDLAAYTRNLTVKINERFEVFETKDYSNASEIPFAVIDEVPIYPGCENLSTNVERRKCMSDKIQKFVVKKFNTDLAADLGLSGRQRINVIFKIDENGNITGIRSRAPHPRLEEEAIRIISLLPKMIPGKQNGKNMTVPYSLPIIFQVQE